MTASRFEQRRDQLRRLVRRDEAEAMLVTSPSNVRYLTGFTGDDSWLLVADDTEVVLSDPRFTTQLEEECPGIERIIRAPGKSLLAVSARAIRASGASRVAFESAHVSVALAEQLSGVLRHVQWQPASGVVEGLREIKDSQEVDSLRNAVKIAEKAFAVGCLTLNSAQTENQFAAALEYQMRSLGGEGSSFETIAAVGDRAALAHYRPGTNRVADGDLLLVDWGAVKDGYRSDLTRVLITGKPTRKQRQVYETVLKAQLAAIKTIRPGVALGDVDNAARKVIAAAGYGRRFGHSLGHGIGLDVHEAPRVAQKEKRLLKRGMVITVEPGIYLPGWGGVRIEDDVLVTRGGHEVLSSLPKRFDECVQELEAS